MKWTRKRSSSRRFAAGLLGCFWLLLATAAPVAGLDLVDVPLEHWSYEFLQRLEIRAGLSASGLETLPLTRGQMADLVRQLLDFETWQPTALERSQVEMLAREFAAELGRPVDDRARHFWRGDHWKFQLHYVVHQDVDRGFPRLDRDLSQTDVRLSFDPRGALEIRNDFLAYAELNYRLRTSDGLLRDDVSSRSGEAEFVFDPSDRFSLHRSVQSYLRYGRGPILVSLGRERVRWGPSRHDPMLLTDDLVPFDALRWQLRWKRLSFHSLNAQLRPKSLLPDDPPLEERHLAAHRLVIQAHRRLTLALSEAVIYGNRGFDFAYLNPLAVFFVTQANLGNRDNALASIDGRLLLPNLELYGEFVADDLNLRRGLSHFGNKFGMAAGFLWLQPFGLGNWDIDGEWSYATQYAYTHHFPINRYEHFGSTLGSRLGPDADRWVVGLRHRPTGGLAVRLFYELERRGQGSLVRDQETREDDTQEFLSGVVERRHQPGLEIRYRARSSLQFEAEYRFLSTRQAANVADAPHLEGHLFHIGSRLEF